jgi:hypothetical protein
MGKSHPKARDRRIFFLVKSCYLHIKTHKKGNFFFSFFPTRNQNFLIFHTRQVIIRRKQQMEISRIKMGKTRLTNIGIFISVIDIKYLHFTENFMNRNIYLVTKNLMR